MVKLIQFAPNIWHAQREFTASGIRISSRMTVVKMTDGSLWLHSPIRLDADLVRQLQALGEVKYIVAPNKAHHLFAGDALATFPDAHLFGAPGLREKRPDLTSLQELTREIPTAWQTDLDQIFVEGIPFGNETVWLHRASGTLIVTDLLQWWQGDLSLPARLFAQLTGVRKSLAIPTTVNWMIKDKAALTKSARAILDWPFDRLIVAHNSVIEKDAYAEVKWAFLFLMEQ